MRILASIILLAAAFPAVAVEKKIWADSFLGRKAPEIVVEEWLSEQPEMKGKWVLVDFWTTWCGPCVEGIPKLNRFHHRFRDRLVVMGMTWQKRREVERMKRLPIQYFSAIDTQRRTCKAFGVKGIPHAVLIDPRGIVRWEGYPELPGFELTEEELLRLIGG